MNTREKIILLGDNLIKKKAITPLVLVIYQRNWVLKMPDTLSLHNKNNIGYRHNSETPYAFRKV